MMELSEIFVIAYIAQKNGKEKNRLNLNNIFKNLSVRLYL